MRCTRGTRRRVVAVAATSAILVSMVSIAGCGGTPPAYIGALDRTFSDTKVAEQCVGDLSRVAEEAAKADGSFAFFSYDGDPLSRRGAAVDFAALEVPNRVEGTSKEDDYRVEQAEPMIEEIKEAAGRPPSVGGTPLSAVLIRFARIGRSSGERPKRAVNCGDGLWTDLEPGMDAAQISTLAEEVPKGLKGMTVDFVGLGASTPGTGRWIERLRPLVARVLEAKGAHLGVYDIELPADWPPDS